jgi:dihydrofolate synthase/folylpolyglutamate synthase
MERISIPSRAAVLLDVAHNPAGAWALRAALSHLEPQPRGITAVFGCLADKPIADLAQILFPLFDSVILTEVDSPRKASLAQMTEAAQYTGVSTLTADSVQDALERAWASTTADALVVVTGSVYLVGAARSLLLEAAE